MYYVPDVEEAQETVKRLLGNVWRQWDRSIVCATQSLAVVRGEAAEEVRVLLEQVLVHLVQRTLNLDGSQGQGRCESLDRAQLTFRTIIPSCM